MSRFLEMLVALNDIEYSIELTCIPKPSSELTETYSIILMMSTNSSRRASVRLAGKGTFL